MDVSPSSELPLSVLRIVSTNLSTEGRNLDDLLYLNGRPLEAKNEWLYHLYMIMQEPQKRLQIYKRASQKLVFLCEPYARLCLSFDLGNARSDDYKQHASYVMDARVWYQNLYQSMLEWASWDSVTLLVKAMTVRNALERFYKNRPHGVMFMEESDLSSHASSSSSKPRSFDVLPLGLEELTDAIRNVLSSKDEVQKVLQLKDEDAKSFINLLDAFMDVAEPHSTLYNKCFTALRHLCGHSGSLPSSFILSTKQLKKQGKSPVSSFGYADLWRGSYDGKDVALKVFKIYQEEDIKITQKLFCREAALWRRLSHPNVTSFLGINRTLFPFCFACEWMPNGNINTYLQSNPASNRLELLVDVARGLEYLHSIGILHGDLKSASVLINSKLHACLSDFGLTALTNDTSAISLFPSSFPSSPTSSIRYTAPELFHPDHAAPHTPLPSPESDVYALSMVMWEVFTGRAPFFEYPREPTVILCVMLGMRPGDAAGRPEGAEEVGMEEGVWELMRVCWSAEWCRRPRVPVVRAVLEEAERGWEAPIHGPGRWPLLEDGTAEARRAKDEQDLEGDEGPPDFTLPRTGSKGLPSFPDVVSEFSAASMKRKFDDASDVMRSIESEDIDRLIAVAGKKREVSIDVKPWDSTGDTSWHLR